MITVVNKHYHQITPHDIYIGRGSILGNPFTHLRVESTKAQFQVQTRVEAIAKYREYFYGRLQEEDIKRALQRIMELDDLKKKVNLVCFCKPQSCHGDIIKSSVDEIIEISNFEKCSFNEALKCFIENLYNEHPHYRP